MNFRKMVKISLQLLKLKHNFKSIQKLLKILKIDLQAKEKMKNTNQNMKNKNDNFNKKF